MEIHTCVVMSSPNPTILLVWLGGRIVCRCKRSWRSRPRLCPRTHHPFHSPCSSRKRSPCPQSESCGAELLSRIPQPPQRCGIPCTVILHSRIWNLRCLGWSIAGNNATPFHPAVYLVTPETELCKTSRGRPPPLGPPPGPRRSSSNLVPQPPCSARSITNYLIKTDLIWFIEMIINCGFVTNLESDPWCTEVVW